MSPHTVVHVHMYRLSPNNMSPLTKCYEHSVDGHRRTEYAPAQTLPASHTRTDPDGQTDGLTDGRG